MIPDSCEIYNNACFVYIISVLLMILTIICEILIQLTFWYFCWTGRVFFVRYDWISKYVTINCGDHKVESTWHIIDKLEAIIQVNHAPYECPSNTRRIEAGISMQVFWINTCCVTDFRYVKRNGELDVWCVAASLGCLPVVRTIATSIRKRRGLRATT
jgi:hypothetical protein